jgi:hypothetical protein
VEQDGSISDAYLIPNAMHHISSIPKQRKSRIKPRKSAIHQTIERRILPAPIISPPIIPHTEFMRLLLLSPYKPREKLLPPIRQPLLRLSIIDDRALPLGIVPLRDLDLFLARLEDVCCAAAADVCAVCRFSAGVTVCRKD